MTIGEILVEESRNVEFKVQRPKDRFQMEEKRLVQLLADPPAISQTVMAEQMGRSLGKVKHYITKLKKDHILERVGTSQKGRWKVIVEDNEWQS